MSASPSAARRCARRRAPRRGMPAPRPRGAHRRRALADAAGEHQRVDAAERRRHRRDRRPQPVHVDVEGERGALVAGGRPASTSRMSAVPARPEQPRLVLERVADLGGGQPAVLQQPQQQAGIDGARAGRHHQALERGEAHRRVDRAAVATAAQRGAGAEVAAHEPQRRPAGRAARRARRARRRATARGSRSGAAASARATPRAARRSPRRPAAWRGRRCRSRPPRARRAARARPRRMRGERRGWCSGARSVSARERRHTSSSTRDRPRGTARRRGRPGDRPRRPRRSRPSAPPAAPASPRRPRAVEVALAAAPRRRRRAAAA